MPPHDIMQVKVTLDGVVPRVWRRLQVPSDYSFWDLHVAIQDAMGWKDCHLHRFTVLDEEKGREWRIGIPVEMLDDIPEDLPGWEVIVKRRVKVGGVCRYEYDFGDSWTHHVQLEAFEPRQRGVRYPRMINGAGACPPEDCGGPPGYVDLLKALSDPSHYRHEELSNWVGGPIDPEAFNIEAVRFDDPKARWKRAFSGWPGF